jgi:hypothetical protein
VVRVVIITPRKLSREHEALLRQLAAFEQQHVAKDRKSWLDWLRGDA